MPAGTWWGPLIPLFTSLLLLLENKGMGAVLQPGLVPPPHMGSAHIPGACKQGGFKGIWDPRCGSYMALSAMARKCLGSEEHGGAAEKKQLSPECKAGEG